MRFRFQRAERVTAVRTAWANTQAKAWLEVTFLGMCNFWENVILISKIVFNCIFHRNFVTHH